MSGPPAISLLVCSVFGTMALTAQDFELRYFGEGPINVHASVTSDGKTERLVATATNNGEPIEYARLCLFSAPGRPCFFELWNTAEWKSGEDLHWDVTGNGHISSIHEAHIESLVLVREKNDKFAKGFAAKMAKQSWDIGRVIDTNRAEYLAGIWQSTATSGSVNASTTVTLIGNTAYGDTTGTIRSRTNTAATAVYGQIEEVAILTDRFLYLAKERGKPAHLIVNSIAPIRLNGSKLILIDSDQKAHEMEIEKQILVPEAAVNAQNPANVDSPTGPSPVKAMIDDDVVALKNAGFGDDFVITRIKGSPAHFDVGTPDLVRLKQAGLSDAVIEAMVQASGAK
jgi:hypothetical protein